MYRLIVPLVALLLFAWWAALKTSGTCGEGEIAIPRGISVACVKGYWR